MSDNNIRQVLEIEKQAKELQEKAKREAQEMPVRAEQEAQAMLARVKAEAQEEARRIIAEAQSQENAKDIAATLNAQSSEFEVLSKKNFDKAVAYVLERVIGRA